MQLSVPEFQEAHPAVQAGTGVKKRQEALSIIGLSLLVSPGLIKHLLRSWAWQKALKAEGVELSFRNVLGVRVASQALAYLAGMGALISEPLKPWLLREAALVEKTIPGVVLGSAGSGMADEALGSSAVPGPVGGRESSTPALEDCIRLRKRG